MKVGITGHQNIPRVAADMVRDMLWHFLEELPNPLVCVTSLAQGADQMCAALVLKRGGSLHAVVPCLQYENSFTNAAAAQRLKSFLAQSAKVETLPFAKPSKDAFLAAGRRVVDVSDSLVAVWDGKASRGKGGTADIVSYARERSVPVTVVWPQGLSR